MHTRAGNAPDRENNGNLREGLGESSKNQIQTNSQTKQHGGKNDANLTTLAVLELRVQTHEKRSYDQMYILTHQTAAGITWFIGAC